MPGYVLCGWQIVIDEDPWSGMEMKKSDGLESACDNSIDWEEECFYQNNRRCAFLNDENLCDLYKELGPDSLCDTCRLYPRHTEEYEGLRELSLSLSCPEAARIILSCKEPVRFLEEETDEEDDFEEFDFMMFSQLEDTRDVFVPDSAEPRTAAAGAHDGGRAARRTVSDLYGGAAGV